MRRQKLVLAVLPLKLAGGPDEDRILAEGLTEDLSHALARFAALEIIAPLSGGAVAALTDQEAASRLGASHLLRGRLLRDGDRFRLAVALVDGETGAQAWSERLEAPAGSFFELQDELVARVSATFFARIEETTLRAARRRPAESRAAYELTFRGMALLKRGSLETDEAARRLFEQALERDPHYARAHAGLSLSWFNEWSYQFWRHFQARWQVAYEHIHKALELDDNDAMAHHILGRLLLFRREFEQASWYLDRAAMLCPNDAELLIQQTLNAVFLGRPEAGIDLACKAMRLNPYHPNSYFAILALARFMARDFAGALATLGRTSEMSKHAQLIEAPAYGAIALAQVGRLEEARQQFSLFQSNFREHLLDGRDAAPGEAAGWFLQHIPFRRQRDLDFLAEGFRMLEGEGAASRPGRVASIRPDQGGTNLFVRDEGGWLLRFAGREARLFDMKGLKDIQRLIERAGEEVHCLDLAEREDGGYGGEEALDDRARQEIKGRIRGLQEELAEAEDRNDLGRAERLREELDQLVETLSRALGLGGRSRRLGGLSERARTTVTWRIRHAIRKVGAVHEELARHLRASLRTGLFCSYQPEFATEWRFTRKEKGPARPN